MSASDEELELRLLLEDGVPHLVAPAERMRQIRHRVGLRRRRRTAIAAAVTGVVAVAAFAVLVGRPVTEVLAGPAASTGPSAAGAPTTWSPPPSPGPKPSVAHFSGLFGLMLTMPGGWHVKTVTDTRSMVAGFTATRPLDGGTPCLDLTVGDFACAPVSFLADGDVLISIRPTHKLAKPVGARTFVVGAPVAAEPGCRAIGGDWEMVGRGVAPADEQLTAYACIRGRSKPPLVLVRKILISAVFGGASAGSPGG